MIYGIGPRALGEQLGVDENDAAAFIETFKAKYPGKKNLCIKCHGFILVSTIDMKMDWISELLHVGSKGLKCSGKVFIETNALYSKI